MTRHRVKNFINCKVWFLVEVTIECIIYLLRSHLGYDAVLSSRNDARISWNDITSHRLMSIIVQPDATIDSFIIFMQTALHVSDDTLIHHQEHIQTVITSGTGRTVFATVR